MRRFIPMILAASLVAACEEPLPEPSISYEQAVADASLRPQYLEELVALEGDSVPVNVIYDDDYTTYLTEELRIRYETLLASPELKLLVATKQIEALEEMERRRLRIPDLDAFLYGVQWGVEDIVYQSTREYLLEEILPSLETAGGVTVLDSTGVPTIYIPSDLFNPELMNARLQMTDIFNTFDGEALVRVTVHHEDAHAAALKKGVRIGDLYVSPERLNALPDRLRVRMMESQAYTATFERFRTLRQNNPYRQAAARTFTNFLVRSRAFPQDRAYVNPEELNQFQKLTFEAVEAYEEQLLATDPVSRQRANEILILSRTSRSWDRPPALLELERNLREQRMERVHIERR